MGLFLQVMVPKTIFNTDGSSCWMVQYCQVGTISIEGDSSFGGMVACRGQ